MLKVILVILVLVIIIPTCCYAEFTEEDIIMCVFEGNNNGVSYRDTLETSSDLIFIIKLKSKCKKALEKVSAVKISCKIHNYTLTATVTKEKE